MNIRVDLQKPIYDGTEVVFRSPVDCSQITGLIVYYKENGITASKEFAFADAHGNNVGDIDHLFAENVVVKVILDLSTNMAFVQNADTNAYLEGRFEALVEDIAASKTLIVTIDGDTADHTSEEIYAHIQNGGVAYLFDGNYYIPINASADDAAAIYMYDDMIADHYYISGDKVNHSEMYFENQSAVLYTEQSLTDEQKAQVRANLGLTNLFDALSWSDVQRVVSLGLAKEYFPIGTQFLVKNSLVGDFLYDVVAHDHFKSSTDSSKHTMTLMCHDIVPLAGIPYDIPEVFYWHNPKCKTTSINGNCVFYLPASYGSFEAGYYMIENVALELDEKLVLKYKDGSEPDKTKELCEHVVMRLGYTDLLPITGPFEEKTECIYDYDLGTLGSATENDRCLNHISRATNGSNNYNKSVIRQVVFKSGTNGAGVFNTTYEGECNFVDSFDPEFLAVVGKVIVPCENAKGYEPYDVSPGPGETFYLTERFFLPSKKEITGENAGANDESTQLEYFKDTSNVDRVKRKSGAPGIYFTRSPYQASTKTVHTAYVINKSGNASNASAGSTLGVVPMCNIVG